MGKGRRPCCDKVSVKKGAWSQVEDLKLISFIQKHVHNNWHILPKLAGLARCGKNCRLRWVNYLKPDLKRGNFTPHEEDAIIKLHEELGNKWSKITSKFLGRTDNKIKNIWNTHLKKRIKNKHSQESYSIVPTNTPTNAALDRSNIDDCLEHKLSHQTSYMVLSSMDGTMEHSNSSSSTSFDYKIEDLNPMFDGLGAPSPNMIENISDQDDKGDKTNSLEELIEIPFEPNVDLWDLLDGDQSNSANFSEVDNNINDLEGGERCWW